MNGLVVSFYTLDTPYEEEVKCLWESCKKWNIPFYTRGFKSRGSWEKNCSIKPELILDCLNWYKEISPIVYLDADAVVKSEPVLFNDPAILSNYDIGVHYLQNELLSGTIWFNNNEKIRELVSLWVSQQTRNPMEWDQRVLQKVIEQYKKHLGLRIWNLPSEYVKIFDRVEMGEAVIQHNQASRKFKKAIKVRHAPDGSIFIVRPDKETEEFLNSHYERLPNQLRWVPKIIGKGNINELREKFEGKIVQIVGKGKSLDEMTADDFDSNLPIIAINQATTRIEALFPNNTPGRLFMMRQDLLLEGQNLYDITKFATIIASYQARFDYSDVLNRTYIYYPFKIGCTVTTLTVCCAINLMKIFNCKELRLYAFDSVFGQYGYANLPKIHPTTPDHLRAHRQKIERHARGVPLKFYLKRNGSMLNS